jgi:uncharacterized membrane protein
MNLYRKFIDGLVMKRYNELTRDSNEVLFTPDYEMSGIRGAVNTMAVTLVIFIALPPNPLFAVFVWIFLCALIGKQAKENKMSKGYPYLKFMEMQVLVFGYLIAIPIAIIIYGLFAFAFESLIFAFTQDWIVASVVRILILFITWIFYMFFFRNNEWDDRNKEWIKKFAAQDQEIEEKENEVREKNGTYENFVKNLDEEFTFPYLKEKEEIKKGIIMYIQKITYISVTDLDRTVLNLNELETLDYQYRTIDGGDEVEIESSIENLDELLKLGIISQEEYNTIEEEVVDTIFLY